MGRPRKVVAEALPPVEEINRTVTNCLKGTTLWLSGGRKLEYGESAETSEEEAVFLRERGQVE